ncbi:MAG: multicopper oxidase domain-containing protein [Candidatus Acidiferrales bacterium]
MSRITLAIFACLCFIHARPGVYAQEPPANTCPRPAIGSPVAEPEDLRTQKGVLQVDLTVHDYANTDGTTRYCYLTPNGVESPTLRLSPGDLLILNLKNDLKDPQRAPTTTAQHHMQPEKGANPCTSGFMSITSANLHFHGLTVPAVCHQDDVLKTSIQPSDPPFQYRFYIPKNEPPGLYWYHPHIHGFSTPQVLGGLSGAMIIEGIERANKEVAGLPERVLIIRDQNLLNPDAPPAKSEPVVPKMLLDRDGDAANNGTGFGKPAKDLSINYVPVPYPDYTPAKVEMKPGERQFWRVLNASAITYLNLEVLYKFKPQQLGIVALDGVPLNANGMNGDFIDWQTHIGIPPGGRVEFIVTGPPPGVPGLLVTRTLDTGAGGENDTNRMLATISASNDAPEPRSTLSSSPVPLPPPALPWLGTVAPVRTRRLYFSEKLENPKDPNSATTFYLTVDGQTPKPFDPTSAVPNIIVHQGDVEDWIIENRSTELHAFHIHQLHFLMVAWRDTPVNEPFLRDTVNVPYFDGKTLEYPSVTLRMDFRDPNTVGTFVYHCHLLEHEDGGMMGTVQVLPKDAPPPPKEKSPSTSRHKSAARSSSTD